MEKMLLVRLATAWCFLTIVSAAPKTCPLKVCAQKATELQRWECVSDFLFQEPDEAERYVEQQCHGLGWGNSISSLSLTVELAALLGARVSFTPERNLGRLWTLPREYKISPQSHTPRTWTYKHEETDPDYYGTWMKTLTASDTYLESFNNTILQPAICGKDDKVIQLAKCITKALPVYGKCVRDMKSSYFELDTIVSLPAFFAVFRKPTALMAQYLREMRTRLSLPQLDPGLEPSPGAWGLYTPGYYLLAFHYRNIPLGFEPLSVMLNEGHHLEYKIKDLEAFWAKAADYARQARDIARCRNETLLIYFATDDAPNLRPVAERVLGGYGRVLFGLEEDDVGHMQPSWTRDSVRDVEKTAAEVLSRRAADAARCAKAAAAPAGEGGGAEAEGTCARGGVNVVSPRRGEEATRRHRDMALVEWWVLGSAQWLATTRHSSFSNTAAWFGLGPAGRMERFEINARPVPRVDWAVAGDPVCRTVGGADPEQARSCPNRFKQV